MLLLFLPVYGGENPFDLLVSGGAWNVYSNHRGDQEQTFMLEVGNCLMTRGQADMPGLAMPGFGLVERPSSMVSRCKRRKPPTLAWDPSSPDCLRLTLTYEEGHAPDSIFGFFVVPSSQNESAAPLSGGEAQYRFLHKVDGEWKTFPFRALKSKPDAPIDMVSLGLNT